MKTSIRAILLGIALAPFSSLGTFFLLLVIFFGGSGRPPLSDLLIASGIVLMPGALLTGVVLLLPVDSAYQKATALGLLLPAIAVCIYFVLG